MLFVLKNNFEGTIFSIINTVLGLDLIPKFISKDRFSRDALLKHIESHKSIICLGFCPFTQEQYEDLVQKGKNITIYSHHCKDNWLSKYDPNKKFISNNEKTAPELYLEDLEVNDKYLLDLVHMLTRYIIYDYGDSYYDLSLFYNDLFNIIGIRAFITSMVSKIRLNNITLTDEERKIIKDSIDKKLIEINKIIKKSDIKTDKFGNTVCIISEKDLKIEGSFKNLLYHVGTILPNVNYFILICNNVGLVRWFKKLSDETDKVLQSLWTASYHITANDSKKLLGIELQ